jgi:gas vesicle protein
MINNSENNHRENTSPSGSVLAALLVGGLLGAGTMMLLAPRSGRETRSQLQHKALQLREQTVGTVKDTVDKVSTRTRDLAGEVKVKAGGLEQQGRDALAKQLDKVAVAAKAGKQAIKPEV